MRRRYRPINLEERREEVIDRENGRGVPGEGFSPRGVSVHTGRKLGVEGEQGSRGVWSALECRILLGKGPFEEGLLNFISRYHFRELLLQKQWCLPRGLTNSASFLLRVFKYLALKLECTVGAPRRAGELGGARPRFPLDFCNDLDGADVVGRSQALFIQPRTPNEEQAVNTLPVQRNVNDSLQYRNSPNIRGLKIAID